MGSCRINNVVDVSCFLLFEASGDSEVDSDDPNMAVVFHDTNANAVDMAYDDAESCSCDLSDYVRVIELKACNVQEYYDGDDDDDDQGEEEVTSNIDQTGASEEILGQPEFAASKVMGGEREKKSKVCVDKNKEAVMNEMEKNRLFWDTCLAS